MLVDILKPLSGTKDAAGDTILVFDKWEEWRKAAATLIRRAKAKFERHDNHRVILSPTRHREHFRKQWWPEGAVGVVYYSQVPPFDAISAYVYTQVDDQTIYNTIRMGRSLKSTNVRVALWDAGIRTFKGEAADEGILQLVRRRESKSGGELTWEAMPNQPAGKYIVTIRYKNRPPLTNHDYGTADPSR